MRLILLCLMFLATGSRAELVTLDFNTRPVGGSLVANYFEDGFRISPNCHLDFPTVPSTGSPGMGWDRAGCSNGNPDFTGSSGLPFGAVVRIDHFGDAFSLLGFHVEGYPFIVVSSTGASFSLGGQFVSPTDVSIAGTDWQDVQWIEFRYVGSDPGVPVIQVDDIRLSVSISEPPVWMLLSVLLMLGIPRKFPVK